jgi:hypothetical protein
MPNQNTMQPIEAPTLTLLPTPKPLDVAIAAYLRRLEADGASPRTLSAYARDLRAVSGTNAALSGHRPRGRYAGHAR